MGWFTFFKRDHSPDALYDFGDLFQSYENLYLKSLSIDKCAEFLARIIASSEFRFLKDGKQIKSEWSYLLNVRPNKNESSTQFWQKAIYRLLTKNEVLIVRTDDDQLLVADSFVREGKALNDDSFQSVVVKGHQFKDTFDISDVIYLQYNNNRLDRYLEGLFASYEKLYSRIVEALARSGQIRGVLNTKASGQFNGTNVEKLQSYADGLFKSFSNKSVAIVPAFDGIDYVELTNKSNLTTSSVDDLKKIKRQFDDDIADILGIPTAILHGDMADLESSQRALNLYCLDPLNKKIETELNSKIIKRSKHKKGEEIRVIGVNRADLFTLAESVDKLISSGAFTRNEIRKELNYESVEGGDEFLITKNYQTSKEKGETDEN